MKKILFAFMIFLVLFSGCTYSSSNDIKYENMNTSSFKMGACQGTSADFAVAEKLPEAQLHYYSQIPDGCAAVKAGKVDGYAFDKVNLEYYAMNNPDTVVMDETIGTVDICAGMRKDDNVLCEKVNKFIAAAKADGTMADMENRWLKSTEHEMPKLEKPKNPKGTLKIITEGTQAPFSYVGDGGRITGFDIELGTRLAYSMNMDVSVDMMSFDALISALAAGKGDVILCELNAVPERMKNILFSDPYIVSDIGILVKADRYTSAAGKQNNTKNEDKTFFQKSAAFFKDLKESFTGTFVTEQRWRLIVSGLWVTIVLSVLSFILATLWGAVLCAMTKSKNRLARGFSAVFMRIVQGTPLLVVIMLLYFVVFNGIDISGLVVAIIGFGLYEGAGLAGIFKTGINSVDKGQLEAAAAIGFKKFDVFKKVILPQAANNVFSLYKGAFVSLVKSTSIVGYIAIQDLTKVSDIIRSRTYDAFFPIITTAVIYFIITYLLVTLLSVAERRLDPKKRKRILKGVEVK